MTHAMIRTGFTALARVLLATTALLAPPVGPAEAEAAPALTTLTTTQTTIVSASFDATRVGPVDPTSFRAAVGPTSTSSGAYAGMTYRHDYRGSGNVVRTELSAGKYIGSTGAGRGNVLVSRLPGSYDSACMAYDIRFATSFDFSAGGKLPGFVGVAPGVPPSTPEGGGSTDHGWSGRLMWLGAKMWQLVRTADRSNVVVTYLYHPGQDREWGDNVSWDSSFTPGVWHRVRQCHVMNTVGKADGVLRTWFDGTLVMQRYDVVYRTDPAVHITHFDWSVFRGGSTADWASPTAGYVDIDNLKITAG
jgi:hypothetical protein